MFFFLWNCFIVVNLIELFHFVYYSLTKILHDSLKLLWGSIKKNKKTIQRLGPKAFLLLFSLIHTLNRVRCKIFVFKISINVSKLWLTGLERIGPIQFSCSWITTTTIQFLVGAMAITKGTKKKEGDRPKANPPLKCYWF